MSEPSLVTRSVPERWESHAIHDLFAGVRRFRRRHHIFTARGPVAGLQPAAVVELATAVRPKRAEEHVTSMHSAIFALHKTVENRESAGRMGCEVVGRPGLEPGTYGLKCPRMPLDAMPYQVPTSIQRAPMGRMASLDQSPFAFGWRARGWFDPVLERSDVLSPIARRVSTCRLTCMDGVFGRRSLGAGPGAVRCSYQRGCRSQGQACPNEQDEGGGRRCAVRA